MKLTKTKIGLIIAVIYLGIFLWTVLLALFDNREAWGNFFPAILSLPWSLIFGWIKVGTQSEMLVAMLKLIPGALIDAWLIYYIFKHFDKSEKSNK